LCYKKGLLNVAGEFQLKLMTPYKSLFDGQVEAIGLPGEMGEFGILRNHTKFVSPLNPGVIRFVHKGNTQKLIIGGGFAEAYAGGVVVLADSAETPDEIDLDRAMESRDRATRELKEADGANAILLKRLYARLARAENRINAGNSK
jgi:F-type H+-transporting ATPase subunit epsilon